MKNIPNILTILRLLCCLLIIYIFNKGVFFLFGDMNWFINFIDDYNIYETKYLLILIIFILACLTDFFDGYLARKKKFESKFGTILDPIADKALIITMCIIIILDLSKGILQIPFYIIILREMIVSLLRFNLGNKNKNIDVSQLSKYKTFIQMLAIGSFIIIVLSNKVWIDIYLIKIQIFLAWLAAFVTFITGVQHFKTYIKLK